jgi:hypothetical protein
MGSGPQFPFSESRRTRVNGLGGLRLSVWDSRHALVLDRRHPSDAVSGLGDDVVLLHFENPLGARIFEAAFWRIQPRSVRGLVRLHDRAHERRQYVCHGQSHADRAGMGYQLQHLGFGADRGYLCDPGRPALGHL